MASSAVDGGVKTAALMGARGDARCAMTGLTDCFTDNGCDEAWLVVVLRACEDCGGGERSRGAATCWWSMVEVSRGCLLTMGGAGTDDGSEAVVRWCRISWGSGGALGVRFCWGMRNLVGIRGLEMHDSLVHEM